MKRVTKPENIQRNADAAKAAGMHPKAANAAAQAKAQETRRRRAQGSRSGS